MRAAMAIHDVAARAYTIPTDAPEADGTASWTSTTLILVQVKAADQEGLGYSYTDASAARLIQEVLANSVIGVDAMDPANAWSGMQRAVRNLGRTGICATAISALDVALWDLKAKLLELPLASLLGRYRDEVEIYGSGGFTTYDDRRLCEQLEHWVERDGCRFVKMKIGSDPARDPARVSVARSAIGPAALFVDANGALSVKQAISLARRFTEQEVQWFEEPVSSDDLEGLRRVRDHVPTPMEVAAGEYAYTADDIRDMLAAGAVDVQQADATRCGGVTGFLQAGALCDAFHIDLSAHCAPALHRHLGCAVPRFRHVEWFHDHVQIEHMLFDGAPVPQAGCIAPDLSQPGLGLVFKHANAERFAAKLWS